MSPDEALSAPWQPMMPKPATHTATVSSSAEEKPVVAMMKQPVRPSAQQGEHPGQSQPAKQEHREDGGNGAAPVQRAIGERRLHFGQASLVQHHRDPAVDEMHRQQRAGEHQPQQWRGEPQVALEEVAYAAALRFDSPGWLRRANSVSGVIVQRRIHLLDAPLDLGAILAAIGQEQ